MAHHPRPDTPESKVEHQADQPGVTPDTKRQDKTGREQRPGTQSR
ncbi:MAG TPA: hypothetical protein VFO12_05000 [Sphingomicrobium sp.]|nr:hypothetical protein [Sphingomicrobium sp.]